MSLCAQCDGLVVWKKLPNRQGRFVWQCFQPDGVTVHWDSCSKRRWQQVKATGQRFDQPMESGYAGSVHGTKFDRINAKPQKGKVRPSGQCRDCVPPWEPCAVCPDQFAERISP